VTVSLTPTPRFQWVTPSGQPAVGYQLFSYIAGTTTPQATFIDYTQTQQNTNPVILDSNGSASVWLVQGQSYKLVLQDSFGNVYWSVDQVTQPIPTASLTQAGFNVFLAASPPYVQTAAELAAGITPTNYLFPSGDIRRYGAASSNPSNHTYINAALAVSANGGNAAYIPATLSGQPWIITTQITVPAGASMYGAGAASVIFCSGCNGLQFSNGAGETNASMPNCFFRDFVLVGSNTTTSTFIGIQCNLAFGVGAVIAATFDNIGITSFQVGIYNRGFQYCIFKGCFTYNCAQGFQFVGQSVTNSLISCNFIRGASMISTGGAGTAYGISMATTAGESPQGIHIYGCNLYGFDHNIELTLAIEVQIEHNDISFAKLIGVNITTTSGGVWVRDNWIECQGGVSGTFGVSINNLGVVNYGDIHIDGNHLTCDTAFAGSQGIYVGNPQWGVEVTDNFVNGFDQGITVFATSNCVVRDNKIQCLTGVYSATSYAIALNASPSNCTCGPNAVVPGNSATLPNYYQTATTAGAGSAFTVGGTSTNFPIGTAVQFDTTSAGIIAGVTYWVTANAATISVAATPAGVNISTSGAYSGHLFATPVDVTYGAGLAPPGLNYISSGSFLVSLSGMTTTVYCQYTYAATGKTVSLVINSAGGATGTSNATTMTGIGVPPNLYPNVGQSMLARTINSGLTGFANSALSTGGVLTYYVDSNNTAFANTGVKGLNPGVSTYQIG
jgi:hypothetical protein